MTERAPPPPPCSMCQVQPHHSNSCLKPCSSAAGLLQDPPFIKVGSQDSLTPCLDPHLWVRMLVSWVGTQSLSLMVVNSPIVMQVNFFNPMTGIETHITALLCN